MDAVGSTIKRRIDYICIVKIEHEIFLPGGDKQLALVKDHINFERKKIAVLGAGSELICKHINEYNPESLFQIVEEYDHLITARINLADEAQIKARLMNFSQTDFMDAELDLVYAQASITAPNRNKIIKEIKRILKDDGLFCAGEITALHENVPRFVHDIWDRANISPIYITDLENYYTHRKLKIIASEDLSSTLKSFYERAAELSSKKILNGSGGTAELKFLKEISHEANAYLRLGGNKYIGFKTLVMMKEKI